MLFRPLIINREEEKSLNNNNKLIYIIKQVIDLSILVQI